MTESEILLTLELRNIPGLAWINLFMILMIIQCHAIPDFRIWAIKSLRVRVLDMYDVNRNHYPNMRSYQTIDIHCACTIDEVAPLTRIIVRSVIMSDLDTGNVNYLQRHDNSTFNIRIFQLCKIFCTRYRVLRVLIVWNISVHPLSE